MKLTIPTEALSPIGCNIASGIILDSISTKDIHGKKYLVNARTLYRNYVNCLEGDVATKTKYFKSAMNKIDIINGFIADTKIFAETCLELGFDLTIYIPDYKKIKSKWKNFVDVNEVKGFRYVILSTEQDACKALIPSFKAILKETDHKLEYVKDMYITTHIGLDLLNYTRKNDVKLLESHTGMVKEKAQWWTKYHPIGKSSMSLFPFIESLYVLLGDGNYVKAQNMKLRKHIYKIALEKHWSSRMSDSEVLSSIKMSDPILGREISNIYQRLY